MEIRGPYSIYYKDYGFFGCDAMQLGSELLLF